MTSIGSSLIAHNFDGTYWDITSDVSRRSIATNKQMAVFGGILILDGVLTISGLLFMES